MDEQLNREERLPGEVVEVYRQSDRREVVETYSRPLPDRRPSEPGTPVKRKHRRRGLWIFLACFAVLAALSAGGLLRGAGRPVGRRLAVEQPETGGSLGRLRLLL